MLQAHHEPIIALKNISEHIKIVHPSSRRGMLACSFINLLTVAIETSAALIARRLVESYRFLLIILGPQCLHAFSRLLHEGTLSWLATCASFHELGGDFRCRALIFIHTPCHPQMHLCTNVLPLISRSVPHETFKQCTWTNWACCQGSFIADVITTDSWGQTQGNLYKTDLLPLISTPFNLLVSKASIIFTLDFQAYTKIFYKDILTTPNQTTFTLSTATMYATSFLGAFLMASIAAASPQFVPRAPQCGVHVKAVAKKRERRRCNLQIRRDIHRHDWYGRWQPPRRAISCQSH